MSNWLIKQSTRNVSCKSESNWRRECEEKNRPSAWQPAIAMTINPKNRARAKNIEIQWHYVREMVQIQYLSRDTMPGCQWIDKATPWDTFSTIHSTPRSCVVFVSIKRTADHLSGGCVRIFFVFSNCLDVLFLFSITASFSVVFLQCKGRGYPYMLCVCLSPSFAPRCSGNLAQFEFKLTFSCLRKGLWCIKIREYIGGVRDQLHDCGI